MRPTDVLRSEHELILTGLSVLESLSRELERGPVDGDAVERVLDFFSDFADGWHHVKEEELLFPALGRAGLPHDGPLAVMAAEHGEGRQLLAELRAATLLLDQPDGRAEFVARARRYVILLAQHIEKENRFLFPMADEILDGSEQAALGEAFEWREAHAPDERERLAGIIRLLAAQLRRG